MLDQIAASVAPPMLTISKSGFSATARIRPGSESGMKSPLMYTNRKLLGRRALVFSACVTSSSMSRGTVFQIVTPFSSRSVSQCAGSGTSLSGITTEPPAARMPKMS